MCVKLLRFRFPTLKDSWEAADILKMVIPWRRRVLYKDIKNIHFLNLKYLNYPLNDVVNYLEPSLNFKNYT